MKFLIPHGFKAAKHVLLPELSVVLALFGRARRPGVSRWLSSLHGTPGRQPYLESTFP